MTVASPSAVEKFSFGKVVPSPSTNGKPLRVNEWRRDIRLREAGPYSLTALGGLIISLQKKLKSDDWDRSLGEDAS